MTRFEADESGDGSERDGLNDEPSVRRWPLHWEGLYPRERWLRLSNCGATRARSGCATSSRFAQAGGRIKLRLSPAALAAWVEHDDSGEWDDPPGKLALLYDLERIAQLLQDGTDPFHPDRDRLPFAQYLINLGCQPPPGDKVLGRRRER